MTDAWWRKAVGWSLGPVGVLATVVVTAIITTTATSYVNLTQHNRTVVEADFGKLKDTSAEFFQLLDSYSLLARTGAPVDEGTQRRFTLAVLKLYQDAESIVKREPALRPEFERYTSALLELQGAANELKGPLNAKKFVESTSKYFEADSDFKSKVASLQRRFLTSIF